MQRIKDKNKISDLEVITADSEKLVSSLTDVMDKFNVKKNFGLFDFLKSKGLALSSLLSIIIILPFHGVASVYALFKSGLHGQGFQGGKDAFYEIKNNENIDWRELLMLHAKRFIYLVNNNINLNKKGITALIFDDTLLEKTGKKIEKVAIVNDHVSSRYILGYKLLVCGFWDGSSFIPIDFTIHREKGKKHLEVIKQHKKAIVKTKKQVEIINKQLHIVEKKRIGFEKASLKYKSKPNRTNKTKFEQSQISLNSAEKKLAELNNQQVINKKEQATAKKVMKDYYAKERLFGLTTKERKEQYKKPVSAKSEGFKRRKEADNDKISALIQMLCRVVKRGIIPNYLLLDSWFFCFEILAKLSELKKGTIKLVSMVKINNQLFTVCETNKEMSIKALITRYERNAQTCKKMKSNYVKVNCFYKGIRLNLFLVRMGKCKTWHIVATTDLDLSFIKLMEIYQIRWSIEIFFKESKQYLNLGSCQSVNFDAQIADTTITMMQHIMLSYFKRLNYQQTIGGLFKSLNQEVIEFDIINRLLNLFWELVEILCSYSGFDFIELQENAIKNQEFMNRIIKMLPEKILSKAA